MKVTLNQLFLKDCLWLSDKPKINSNNGVLIVKNKSFLISCCTDLFKFLRLKKVDSNTYFRKDFEFFFVKQGNY